MGRLASTCVVDGIGRYDGNNRLVHKYVHGPGVDQPVCMIDVPDSNAAYYYHFDGLGSVIALSDADGNTAVVYEYDVYGRAAASDPNHPNPFLFTARRFDTETSLYYYRARYYNPYIGRFLQTDPVGYGDGMNLYRYCANSPLNGVDPSGLVDVPIVFDPCDPCAPAEDSLWDCYLAWGDTTASLWGIESYDLNGFLYEFGQRSEDLIGGTLESWDDSSGLPDTSFAMYDGDDSLVPAAPVSDFKIGHATLLGTGTVMTISEDEFWALASSHGKEKGRGDDPLWNLGKRELEDLMKAERAKHTREGRRNAEKIKRILKEKYGRQSRWSHGFKKITITLQAYRQTATEAAANPNPMNVVILGGCVVIGAAAAAGVVVVIVGAPAGI